MAQYSNTAVTRAVNCGPCGLKDHVICGFINEFIHNYHINLIRIFKYFCNYLLIRLLWPAVVS